jgi:hypothetical protein
MQSDTLGARRVPIVILRFHHRVREGPREKVTREELLRRE